MRLKIPLAGTVLQYDPKAAQVDGLGIAGDNNDPIRPININLGNVSWRLVTIDLENDLAEIEVRPGENVSIVIDGGNPDNPEDQISRPATAEEKQGFLDYAKSVIEGKTPDELYTISKEKRLVKPAKAVNLYKQKPPNVAAREQILSQ